MHLERLLRRSGYAVPPVHPTIEGDPITWTVLVRGPGRIELVIDSRQDRFSSREVLTIRCTGMARDEGVGSGGIRLTLAGCDAGAALQIP